MKHLTTLAAPDSPQPGWTCPVCGSAPGVPQPGSPSPQRAGPPLPGRAGLLLDWLAENHQAPGLRVGDIAAAAGISARRLQAICKQDLGCTPMRLLADIRMHHVHAALTGPGPAPGSIAEAARMAGISRVSRFRAAYRNRYGTAPVITPRTRND